MIRRTRWKHLILSANNRFVQSRTSSRTGHIIDVIDGDTVKMRLHFGFNISIIETMRLRGVNAMEINFKEGNAAKRALQRMLLAPQSLHALTYHRQFKKVVCCSGECVILFVTNKMSKIAFG